ncbi:MAG TPA: gas vesicle protein GvpD P-loop domain-containing protein [Thermoplasmata archaeon]|jgi:KaiC/GvpD/RAD55 family RecA-like ATPase|nr:gas vesicle protein GvpD P-loop domain-containing protein [Thermoplasmata archaeon]
MADEPKRTGGVPPEVLVFLSGRGGRSLIVKGGAGTGKTTFGLELLERIGKPNQSYYLSTRVGDEALYRQFPWLKATEMRARILDAGKLFLDAISAQPKSSASELPDSEQKKIRAAREMMRTFDEERGAPTRVDRTHLTALMKRNPMPEVENVYNRVEKALPEKSLLVIDSLEGVTHKYGLEMEEFVMALQKDLVESSNTNVVMILEKPEAGGIEYLVDGLISIQREELDERRVRHMRLEKLRATNIQVPRYAVTLSSGRFEALGFQVATPGPQSSPVWHPVADPDKHYSTGIPDFDQLLGGGFKRGSFNAFEVDVNVGIDDYYMLFTPTFLNFLTQSRGIIAVLAAGESHEKLRETLVRHTPPNVFDTRVRIADYTANETEESYIVPMARYGRDEAMRAMVTAEKAARGPEQKPFLEYTAFDTLESLMGDQVAIRMYFHGVRRTKLVGNLGIGLLKPGLLVSSEILNMMDTYFRIINIDNAPCIYGIRPRTTIYAISPDPEKGAPHAKLTPIV